MKQRPSMSVITRIIFTVVAFAISAPSIVFPTAETFPVGSKADAADDPTIVVNPQNPANSFIVGTNKNAINGGLQVYRLDGSIADTVADPAINNVDSRDNFPFSTGSGALLAGSRRPDSSIALYTIDQTTGKLKNVEAKRLKTVECYGMAMGYNPSTKEFFVYLNEKSGTIEQWRLFPTENGLVDGEKVRTLKVPTQPEGMVVDDQFGTLFVGEEDSAIWKFDAWPDQNRTGTKIDSIFKGSVLKADVEGMSIYTKGDSGYLVVSNQGNHSYVLYDRRPPHAFVGEFVVELRGTIDGSEETDGLHVTSMPMGTIYPEGALVVQDGFNRKPRANQNFKIINWKEIRESINLPK